MTGFSLSTKVFDVQGNLTVREASVRFRDRTVSRRVQVRKTLDGGIVHQDFGSNPGDNARTLTWRVEDEAQDERAEYLVNNYSKLSLALFKQLFTIAPDSYNLNEGVGTITYFVLSVDATV